jgi:hypothetical protein
LLSASRDAPRFAAVIVPVTTTDLDAAAAPLRLTLVETGIEPDSATEIFDAVALRALQQCRYKGLARNGCAPCWAQRQTGEIGEVWLSVALENLPARALYEKLGLVGRADPSPAMFVPAHYLTMLWRPDR